MAHTSSTGSRHLGARAREFAKSRKMEIQRFFKKLHNDTSKRPGKYLIGFYGGLGVFLGATLSEYFATHVPSEFAATQPKILGVHANLTFGIVTFVLLLLASSSESRLYRNLEINSVCTFVLMMSIATLYVLTANNPRVISWIGGFGVLVSLIMALYFYYPIDSIIMEEIGRTKSDRKLSVMADFLRMKHGDYVKFVDLSIVGTLALFAAAMAWLHLNYPLLAQSNHAILVYALWFTYNFIGVIVGVISQLFLKLAAIDEAFVSMLKSAG